MKTSVLKIAVMMTAAGFCSCNKDDTDGLIIKRDINGITFMFCLLNEHGQPATVFKEGENFYFYFSSKNTGEEDLYFDTRVVSYNKDFFRVHDSSGTDLGKSYDPFPQTDIGIAAYPFNVGDVYVIKVPWLHEEGSIPHHDNLGYYSVFQKPLVKGSYYTSFSNSFYYVVQQGAERVRTDSINFKINFQIK